MAKRRQPKSKAKASKAPTTWLSKAVRKDKAHAKARRETEAKYARHGEVAPTKQARKKPSHHAYAAERKRRAKEVAQLRREREARAKGKRGYGKADVETSRFTVKGKTYEKTVQRWRGVQSIPAAAAELGNAPQKGRRTWVQLGDKYGNRANWVGSRVTRPGDAGFWLSGFGVQYARGGALGRPSQVIIEAVTLRQLRGRWVSWSNQHGHGRKWVSR